MDQNDRRAIDDLFAKIEDVSRKSGARDAEAERYIADRVARVPGAAYLMAQTIIVQEQALEQAQRQIEPSSRQGGGGFLSSIFGGGSTDGRSARRQGPWDGSGQRGYGRPGMGMGGMGGGGFLAGAAQTAVGIGGGILLANAVGSMFDGDDGSDSGGDSGGGDDGGGDFGGGE